MANAVKWSAMSTFTECIHGTASTPTMKNLAALASVLGVEIDNSGGDLYGIFEVKARGASAFAAGDYLAVYFILSADGTNYEDGSSSITPEREPDLVFPVRAVSTQQKITVKNVLLPPCKFKTLLVNNTNQNLTNTDSENVLNYRTYSNEMQ